MHLLFPQNIIELYQLAERIIVGTPVAELDEENEGEDEAVAIDSQYATTTEGGDTSSRA